MWQRTLIKPKPPVTLPSGACDEDGRGGLDEALCQVPLREDTEFDHQQFELPPHEEPGDGLLSRECSLSTYQRSFTPREFILSSGMPLLRDEPNPDHWQISKCAVASVSFLALAAALLGLIALLPHSSGWWRGGEGDATQLDSVLRRKKLEVTIFAECSGVELGDRLIQIGEWRFGDLDGHHASVSHVSGQTALIYSSDGTLNPGAHRHYGLWNRSLGSQRAIKYGDRFIQVGEWRFGDVDGHHASISHRDGKTALTYWSDGTLHAGPSTDYGLWKRPVGSAAGIKCGDRFIQVGDWRFGDFDGKHASVSHKSGKTAQIYQSDGTLQAGPRTDYCLWGRAAKQGALESKSGQTHGVLTFYMYRAQSDEDYPPENQNLGNLAGVLWYLQNEVIWHRHRYSSFANVSKTRIERFKVQVRPPPLLSRRGMNFGVVNEFDLGQCTGPFQCNNLLHYGPAVGCESWEKNTDFNWSVDNVGDWTGNTFPHQMWVVGNSGKRPEEHHNHYPGALWYSLPGNCSSRPFWSKDEECQRRDTGGACPHGVVPTGEPHCTYSYEKIGEISINELEGIQNRTQFEMEGGREYIRELDEGKKLNFWNGENDPAACKERIDKLRQLFDLRHPEHEHLADPICDFDLRKFYPYWPDPTMPV